MTSKKQAKKIKHKIVECFSAVNMGVELYFYSIIGDLIVFILNFALDVSENKIRKHMSEVRQRLNLKLLQTYNDGSTHFLIASKTNAIDNRLLGVLFSPSYTDRTKDMKTPYTIGFDCIRNPIIVDFVEHPHWIFGGSSKSGKTEGIKNLITNLAFSCSPEDLKIAVFDGASNLAMFDGLPHLCCPIIQDPGTGHRLLLALECEMEKRLKIKNENIEEFHCLPYIVCVLDESISLISGISRKQISQDVPDILSHLLRKGRNAKILLVLAAHDPLVKDMKCDIGNATARIAFTCAKPHYSVTILGEGGAEKLCGDGELLFKSSRHQGLLYMKGAYISDDEIKLVCQDIQTKFEAIKWNDKHKFSFDANSTHLIERATGDESIERIYMATLSEEDMNYAKIVLWTLEQDTVSGNAISKEFATGDRQSNKIVDKLYKHGIVGELKAKNPRKVIISKIEDLPEEVLTILNQSGLIDGQIPESNYASNATIIESNAVILPTVSTSDLIDELHDLICVEAELLSQTSDATEIFKSARNIVSQTSQFARKVSKMTNNTGNQRESLHRLLNEISDLAEECQKSIEYSEYDLLELVEKTNETMKLLEKSFILH